MTFNDDCLSKEIGWAQKSVQSPYTNVHSIMDTCWICRTSSCLVSFLFFSFSLLSYIGPGCFKPGVK